MIRTVIFACVIMAPFPMAACACDTDAYTEATLDILAKANLYPVDKSGCGWLNTCSDQDIAQARQRAKDIRAFSIAHPQDACAQEQYESWANYVEYQADKGEREMKTHETKNEYDKIDQSMKDTRQRAREIKKKLATPDTP
jgi:hypothetical protein